MTPQSVVVSLSVRVLVVDDNDSTRETIRLILGSLRMNVEEADSGATALARLRARGFDLTMIDLNLPDMSGLDLVAKLNRENIRFRWLLMSGWLTIPEAVEAMRLGAVNAVAYPFDIQSMVVASLDAKTNAQALSWRAVLEHRPETPRSTIERWAMLVARACHSPHDLKTLRDWGAFVGVGYSSLTEACRLVGIPPHEARDFLRVLRALVASGGRGTHLELALDINDHRTLKVLLRRAGLADNGESQFVSVLEFIQRQQFIDPNHEALPVLLRWFDIGT